MVPGGFLDLSGVEFIRRAKSIAVFEENVHMLHVAEMEQNNKLLPCIHTAAWVRLSTGHHALLGVARILSHVHFT
jgi:hypothetical protein